MGLKGSKSLKMFRVKDEKKSEQELRANIDNIIDQHDVLDQNGTFENNKILDEKLIIGNNESDIQDPEVSCGK